MAKIDLIVGAAIIIYFATAITEIVSAVPVGLTQSQFGDNCILSASTKYYPGNNTMIVTSFGSPGTCGYCTYLTIFTVLYSLAYGSYSAYALYKSADNAALMWVLPAIMACLLLMILKFISSCILSVGFSRFCKSVSSSSDIKSCQSAQGSGIRWFHGEAEYSNLKYHAYMTTAQSASWFCFFEWFLLTALAFLHYRRNISLRSFGQVVGGFGSTDTEGIVSNEVLPGST